MSENSYAIIFRGDILPGFLLPDVKQNLKKVFKADDARIAGLFNNKPVVLKKQLSYQEASRYQAVLQQAGAAVSIEPLPASEKATRPGATTEASLSQRSQGGRSWQLAPVGSLLVDANVEPPVATEIDISHLALLPQSGYLLSEDERQSGEENRAIEVEDWRLTPYGESLLRESERASTASVDVDISRLSIAEGGGYLLKEEERAIATALMVATDHIELLPYQD